MNERLVLPAILLLAFIVLLAPSVSRIIQGYPLLYGPESAQNALIGQLFTQGMPSSHPFVNGRPHLQYTPYHWVLGALSLFVGIELASVILPIILGLLSLMLLFQLLSPLSSGQRALALLIIVVSPAFIYTFTASSTALLLFIYLAVIWLAKRGVFILAIPLLLLTPLFGSFAVLMSLFVITVAALLTQKNLLGWLFSGIFLLGAIALSNSAKPWLGLARALFSDLGSLNGFSAFCILLSALAIPIFWQQRSKLSLAYHSIFILVPAFWLFGSMLNAYLLLPLSIFSALLISHLERKRWKGSLIKSMTLLIIWCGLLFSSASYLARLSTLDPSQTALEAMSWLHDQQPGNVLAPASRGFWIEYYANMPVLADGLSPRNPAELQSLNDTYEIYQSRNLKRTTELLDKDSVRYLWIDNEMMSGEIWSKPSDGLLFLFRSNETFKRAFVNQNVQIWEYIGG